MELNSTTNDYLESWLDEELILYFDFLDVHYRIIFFRQKKRLELLKKFPNLKSYEITKKIDKLQKKEFGNQLTLICERKVNSFLT